EVGDGDHIGGVLQQRSGGAVVGVVVVGPVGQDQVGADLADQAHDRAPVGQARLELAVVVVQHSAVDADHGRCGLRLRLAPPCEGRSSHLIVAGVAVGGRHEVDVVAGTHTQGGQP